jgi:hypothetical protein
MTGKILKTVIVLVVLSGLGILGYHIVHYELDTKCGETYRWILSEKLTVVEYNNDEISILNNATNKITGRYDRILYTYGGEYTPKEESVHVVIKDDLRGYISAETGEVIFEPQFLHAWLDDAESNFAACVNKDGKLGFINVKTKEVVIPFEFDYEENSFFVSEHSILDFIFSNGICIVPGKEGTLGIIDKTGNLLLPIEFLDIINWRDKNTPNIILKKYADEDSDYSYLYGVCDRNFNMIVPFEYNNIQKNTQYDENYNIFVRNYIVQKEDMYGILDTLFNIILPVQYSNIEVIDSIYIVSLNEKYGVLDNKYQPVLPIEFDWIGTNGKNNEFIAKKENNQKLYDSKGGIIHNCFIENYEDINVFEEIYEKDNIAPYVKYYLDGYYGILDDMQNVVIPAKYDKIKYIGNKNFVCTKGNYSLIIKDKQ